MTGPPPRLLPERQRTGGRYLGGRPRERRTSCVGACRPSPVGSPFTARHRAGSSPRRRGDCCRWASKPSVRPWCRGPARRPRARCWASRSPV